MIVVRIEMWPRGNEKRKYPLGEIRIANVGGTEASGDYSVTMLKRHRKSVWKTGHVHAFKRKRLGPYDLLLRSLIACIGDRAPKDVAQVGDGQLFANEEGETCP